MNIASGKVEHIIPVGQEPEGVATAPGWQAISTLPARPGATSTFSTRPATSRSVISRWRLVRAASHFLPTAHIGFIPSESAGQLNVIDTADIEVMKSIDLPPGSRPMRVRVAPRRPESLCQRRAGRNHVRARCHSYALLDTIKVGTRPWGIVLPPMANTSSRPTARRTTSRSSIWRSGKEIDAHQGRAEPLGHRRCVPRPH